MSKRTRRLRELESRGITAEAVSRWEKGMASDIVNPITKNPYCPASFTDAHDMPIVCLLDKGHDGLHKANIHTKNEVETFLWPEMDDENAPENYIQRKYKMWETFKRR